MAHEVALAKVQDGKAICWLEFNFGSKQIVEAKLKEFFDYVTDDFEGSRHEITAGIDFSINCPSVCIGDGHTFYVKAWTNKSEKLFEILTQIQAIDPKNSISLFRM